MSTDPSLAHFSPVLPLVVAYSGGADSSALLLACAKRWPGQIKAVHIHHGLQKAADDFASHCQTVCDALNVPLVIQKVDARHSLGESPEDAARKARYKALASAIELNFSDAKDVALAQHADDQIETLLLALSRGAGLPGIAAMPAVFERSGLTFHRPWLQVPSQQLRHWLTSINHLWIEDPSNTDIQLTRNRIRHVVLPALEKAFPQFRQTFARSAAHAAQAQTVLDEMAQIDWNAMQVQAQIVGLQALSDARMVNVLRFWLKNYGVQSSTAQLHELMAQVRACTTRGHQIDIKVGEARVQRKGECLTCYNSKAFLPQPTNQDGSDRS